MEKKTTVFKDFTSHRAYLLLELLGKPQTAERKSWGNNPFWGGERIKGRIQNLSPCKLNSKGIKKEKVQEKKKISFSSFQALRVLRISKWYFGLIAV